MKLCPICGTAVMVKMHMLLGQIDHGVWVIAGANSADALADMCEQPMNECYCPNESCGDAHVYTDSSKLMEVTTIPCNPLSGMVTIDQLKDYYYSVIDPKYPENRPREDEHFLEWVSTCIGHQPWQGVVMECIDD
jgi:hypothetical protein